MSAAFDPSAVAKHLGKAQRAVILSLRYDRWSEASSHQCAKRMFYGVRGGWLLVDHKHCTDNCWQLSHKGQLVKEALTDAAFASL